MGKRRREFPTRAEVQAAKAAEEHILDQGPEVFRAWFEERGIVVDEQRIVDFVNETVNGRKSAQAGQNAMAAAAFLTELIQAAKRGDSWNGYKSRIGLGRKLRANKFDPGSVTLDSPALGIVTAYARGQITRREAIDEFDLHVCPASERQIESWIAAMKPMAEKWIAAEETFRKLALAGSEKK